MDAETGAVKKTLDVTISPTIRQFTNRSEFVIKEESSGTINDISDLVGQEDRPTSFWLEIEYSYTEPSNERVLSNTVRTLRNNAAAI